MNSQRIGRDGKVLLPRRMWLPELGMRGRCSGEAAEGTGRHSLQPSLATELSSAISIMREFAIPVPARCWALPALPLVNCAARRQRSRRGNSSGPVLSGFSWPATRRCPDCWHGSPALFRELRNNVVRNVSEDSFPSAYGKASASVHGAITGHEQQGGQECHVRARQPEQGHFNRP